MKYVIPFNRPPLAGNEQNYMLEALTSGHIAGNGTFSRRCQTLLEKALGVNSALLTTSCTDALEMAALLLNIQRGDEIITPSFTFVSTANAFVLHGAKPVFIDSRTDTLNLDETKLEGLITSRTRAIVVMHYAGVGCEMDNIMEIARRYKIPVIEDNAHGLFGKYKGRFLGTFGAMSSQSFHETKNFSCGEGGALFINEQCLAERAEIIREKGTNRSSFVRGEVDKYTWVDLGSSYLMSDLLAAFLLAQLEKREDVQAKRRKIWDFYYAHLKKWAQTNNVRLPAVPLYCEQPYHIFYLLMPSLEKRQYLIEHLKRHGISSVFHYFPLHLSKMGRKFGGKEGDCPVSEDISSRILRLPFFNDLKQVEQQKVIEAICEADI